jgi:hypothetical protein
MWDYPPPYPGMGQTVPNPPPQNQPSGGFGPSASPYPATSGTPYPAGNPPYPAGGPPSYNQATALPQKVHLD